MQKYKYVATDKEGNMTHGVFVGESEAEIREMLLRSGYYVTSIKAVSTHSLSSLISLGASVPTKDLTQFCNQFSVMILAGVPIVDSVALLKDQTTSRVLKKTLGKIEEDLKQGLVLSDAMRKYPRVFPTFFSSMVYVGENAGCLDKVLVSIAEYYEQEDKTKQKTRAALAYPILLLILTIGVVVVMFVFVIPRFVDSFSKMNVEMPALTMAIFNMSLFFQEYWLIVLGFLIAFIILLFLLKYIPSVGMVIDQLKVTLPIMKNVNMARFTARFARSLGLLLENGSDTLSALENVHRVIDNKYLLKQFNRAMLDVKMGMSLSKALSSEMTLPPILIEMIIVGEQTGELGQVLLKTAPYFDSSVQKALDRMTAVLQPTLLLVLGGIIATLFVAMYSPILAMITSLQV